MTDQERLENIKWFNATRPLTHQEAVWLIEQAEKKQELEMKYENTGSMFGRQNQRLLIEENQKLREAVEFYAVERNYLKEYSYKSDDYMESVVTNDGGKIARQALEETK